VFPFALYFFALAHYKISYSSVLVRQKEFFLALQLLTIFNVYSQLLRIVRAEVLEVWAKKQIPPLRGGVAYKLTKTYKLWF